MRPPRHHGEKVSRILVAEDLFGGRMKLHLRHETKKHCSTKKYRGYVKATN